jgi:tRNA(Arg) A34 adenosine deaminase TadA
VSRASAGQARGARADGGHTLDARPTDADHEALREAISLSAAARAGGCHPFGAMVLAADGSVLARAGNRSAAGEDPTAHAETLAVRLAAATHGRARLAGGALVSSAEPCAMCAGAAYWAGLSRIVYGLSERRLRALTGNHPDNPTLDLPCRTVFAAGQRRVEVVGPLLEDEAAAVHDGFWSPSRGEDRARP